MKLFLAIIMSSSFWGAEMDNYRIKVKIGEHEFEAEGPAELVKSQFESFKDIIASTPRQTPASGNKQQMPQNEPVNNSEIQLDKISKVDGRVVSLTIKPEAESTAAILIMLAQRTYRANETVTASEIKDGLEQSGYRTGRIDRLMQPLADEGSVVRIGARKGARYRFTNQGLVKAQAAARDVLATIP
jgi:hypothetical protein